MIAKRAKAIDRDRFDDVLNTSMNLTAYHLNAQPLDLDAMLLCEDHDLLLDLLGIEEHLDKDTGALTDCWLPRMCKRMDNAR